MQAKRGVVVSEYILVSVFLDTMYIHRGPQKGATFLR